MRKAKYKKIWNVLLYIPLLLLAYILQGMVFSMLPIFGAKPLIIPLAVVGIALFGGYFRGGVFGLFAGILCDLSFNQPPIQFTVFLTIVGLLIGLAADMVLAKGFPTYFLCCLLTLLLSAFVQSFSLLFYYNCGFMTCLTTALIQAGYSLLFSLPVYLLSRSVSRVRRT